MFEALTRTSRLYSEKAYVLSRSFVRTALERPPSGLENEIAYFYLSQGRLASVIDHARKLMIKGERDAARSSGGEMIEENAEMWNADAMGSLTMGAILSLKVGLLLWCTLGFSGKGESYG
jgi:ubiquitin-conjugating enzyme E2 O